MLPHNFLQGALNATVTDWETAIMGLSSNRNVCVEHKKDHSQLFDDRHPRHDLKIIKDCSAVTDLQLS